MTDPVENEKWAKETHGVLTEFQNEAVTNIQQEVRESFMEDAVLENGP